MGRGRAKGGALEGVRASKRDRVVRVRACAFVHSSVRVEKRRLRVEKTGIRVGMLCVRVRTSAGVCGMPADLVKGREAHFYDLDEARKAKN